MSDPEKHSNKTPRLDVVARSIGRHQTRRGVLGGIAVVAAAIAGTRFGREPEVRAQAQRALDDAVTAEGLLVTLLGVARTRATELGLDEQTIRLLRAAQCEDDAHYNNLIAAGGAPTTGRYTFAPELWTAGSAFLDAWVALKRITIGLYLAAARTFGEEDADDLVELAFQIGTVEAQHYALLRQYLGERIPADRAFPEWQFASTTEAQAAIAALGFIDGNGDEFSYPGPGDRYCRGITGLVSETTSDQSPPDITPDPASPVSSDASPEAGTPVASPEAAT